MVQLGEIKFVLPQYIIRTGSRFKRMFGGKNFIIFIFMNDRTDVPVVQKGGFAIYEKGGQIILVDHQIGGLITMTFVLLILTPMLLVAGGMFISLNLTAGALILLASGLCAYAVYWGFTSIKRKKSANLNEQAVIAILDFDKEGFMDSNGNSIAPLREVKFTKGFQITSSSPSIKANWSGNSIEVFSFNGLVGGSGAFISYFKEKGLWGN